MNFLCFIFALLSVFLSLNYAFTASSNFNSCIFNTDFDGLQGLKSELPICEDSFKIAKLFNEGVLFVPKASNLLKWFFELVNCLMKGCYLCLRQATFLFSFLSFITCNTNSCLQAALLQKCMGLFIWLFTRWPYLGSYALR